MPRSYWCVVIALVGCLTLGAASQPEQQPQVAAGNPSQQSPERPQAPSAANNNPVEAREDKGPSGEPDQESQNSLEVARQAAHEAKRAADWARIQTILGVCGFIGLLYTLHLTIKSNDAEAAALRNTLIAERPYIFLWKTKKDAEGKCLGVTFRNFGRMPGFVERMDLKWGAFKTPPIPDPDTLEGRVLHKTAIAIHGEEYPSGHYIRVSITPAMLQEAKRIAGGIYVYGTLVYRDPFDKRHRHWFCYVYDGRNFVPESLNDPRLNGYDSL